MKNLEILGKDNASYTFSECTNLKQFIVENKVTTIAPYTFYKCTALETLVIGNSVTELKNGTIISKCTNIQNLYLGNSITTLHTNCLGQKVPNVYLFSDKLSSVYKNTSSGKYCIETDVIYVNNPERYEALLADFNVKPLLTFNETSVEYSGKTPELSYKNNVEGMDVSFDSSTTPKDAGSYNTEIDVTFTGTDFDWNTTVQIPCSYTITKAPLQIMTNNVQRYYGEENPELTCEYMGFKNGETSEVLIAQPNVYTTATKDSYVGTYPIYCTGAEAKNYTITAEPGTLTIIKAPQTITWNQDFSNVTVGDEIELNATCSSGLAVKYRSSDMSAVLITTKNGKQYAYILKAGMAAITAYQSGDTNHEEADEISLLVNATVSGISGIISDTEQQATYYNVNGQRINSQHDGLVIMRQADGTTKKIIRK